MRRQSADSWSFPKNDATAPADGATEPPSVPPTPDAGSLALRLVDAAEGALPDDAA